ncbi:MAG: S46 family peptidase [Chlorobi bacterium]|nr:S46 family peptidase [Chlorobiota bacterium]
MKKFVIVFLSLIIGFSSALKADEGMWVPLLINKNIAEMQKMGFKLTAEDIYSINHASLKDAVVIFGGGCTGEIVSPKGLLFTNHHCGYSSIQKVSTPENNYLEDGFKAGTLDEEIPIKGLTVKFLVYMQDVTKEMHNGINESMTDEEKTELFEDNKKGLIQNAIKNNKYNAVIKPLFGGNNYYLYVYQTYKDIRLVFTVPQSIGKFGADTDNWMWPRHTGDFSVFRVYTAPDGSPATYSTKNIPLKPKKYLPVSIAGVEEGDFAMIMGNPGRTQRYLSSYGVKLALDQTNMTIVDIRAEKLRIMKESMDTNDVIRLQYASKYARVSNYWKYFIGQTKGLKNLHVLEKKQAEEEAFRQWLDKNPNARLKYGDALDLLKNAHEVIGRYNLAKIYYKEAISRGPEILKYAYSFKKLKGMLADKNTPERDINKEIMKLKENVLSHFKDYNVIIDKGIYAAMMKMYYENVPFDQRPVLLLENQTKFKGDWTKYADYVYEKSIFDNPEEVKSFLEKPRLKTLEKDPALLAATAFYDENQKIKDKTKEAEKELKKGHKLYIAGLMAMYPDKNFYPDANFTMRVTYGTVKGYSPADAVYYNYYTTLKGVMQKENPKSWEFTVPEKLKELYKAKDYGRYGENGEMRVCFLTNNDITGGNSGSPVLNANGELIGLAFDGNWEAMSGDIAFEPELQRTINVDIRYVLFLIDKFGGAKNLIDELTITDKRPVREASMEKSLSTVE